MKLLYRCFNSLIMTNAKIFFKIVCHFGKNLFKIVLRLRPLQIQMAKLLPMYDMEMINMILLT